jgi:hypothetical protein
MGRIEEELAGLERTVASGDGGPDALSRLGQLYLRVNRPGDAHRVFAEAYEAMQGVVHDASGSIELNALRDEVKESRDLAKELFERSQRDERRAELLEGLDSGTLEADLQDELIRLQVRDGLAIRAETPRCPACWGPMAEPAQDGSITCARSGTDGDLCRHVGADGLYACGGCGLVVRGWNERKLRVEDSKEPPFVRPKRSRCKHCQGRVADWKKHFVRCPKARPVEFPVCGVCNRRGFHVAALECPRCAFTVAELPCMERSQRLRR